MCERHQEMAVCSFTLLLPWCAAGQTATTSIRGSVVNPLGAVIANASVTLSAPEIGINTVKQANGKRDFSELTAGRYLVKIRAPGFGESTTAVELLMNQPTTVNVTLGSTDVSLTDATIGTLFITQQIQILPFESNNINGSNQPHGSAY